MTVKYIYGPATTTAAQDGDIGSSISGRLETGIGLHRLTTIPMPMRGTDFLFGILFLRLLTFKMSVFVVAKGVEPQLRVRKGKASTGSLRLPVGPKAVPTKFKCSDPIGVLKAGSQTVRHHKLGWLKEDLIASGELEDTKEAVHAKIWADYNAQKIYIRAQQDIMGEDLY